MEPYYYYIRAPTRVAGLDGQSRLRHRFRGGFPDLRETFYVRCGRKMAPTHLRGFVRKNLPEPRDPYDAESEPDTDPDEDAAEGAPSCAEQGCPDGHRWWPVAHITGSRETGNPLPEFPYLALRYGADGVRTEVVLFPSEQEKPVALTTCGPASSETVTTRGAEFWTALNARPGGVAEPGTAPEAKPGPAPEAGAAPGNALDAAAMASAEALDEASAEAEVVQGLRSLAARTGIIFPSGPVDEWTTGGAAAAPKSGAILLPTFPFLATRIDPRKCGCGGHGGMEQAALVYGHSGGSAFLTEVRRTSCHTELTQEGVEYAAKCAGQMRTPVAATLVKRAQDTGIRVDNSRKYAARAKLESEIDNARRCSGILGVAAYLCPRSRIVDSDEALRKELAWHRKAQKRSWSATAVERVDPFGACGGGGGGGRGGGGGGGGGDG